MRRFAGLRELSACLAAGEYSAVELTRHYLDMITAAADANVFITVDENGALAAAEQADATRAASLLEGDAKERTWHGVGIGLFGYRGDHCACWR